VLAEVEPKDGRVTLAAAGHMPPVTIEPGGEPMLFMDGRSPPLGAGDPQRARGEAQFVLGPDSAFLLYTDGLVERRGEAIDDGLERLLGVVRAIPGVSTAELVRTLPERLLGGERVDDDVCLLAFRRLG
jgi:serine phosphatase RsbU (regulator of sigma subunit)